MRKLIAIAGGCVALVGGASAFGDAGGAGATKLKAGGNWTRFGYDAARHNAGPTRTGITGANVAHLRRQRVAIGGTADSSPIYLRGVPVRGARHDVFIVTTSYGRAVAVDAGSGRILWRFTPRGYSSWAGSSRITNSSPIVSIDRRFVYSASPGGQIHKLSVATGAEVRTSGWPATITRSSRREKIGPALNLARGLVLAATGGYVGDAPPYQGHVVAIDAASGAIRHVWNALCSDRKQLISPASCSESGAAIWGRAGVVVAPRTGRLLVATGDGRWNGRTHWGDSVLMLTPTAERLLQNWTPASQADLDSGDVDLGSTAPAILSPRYAVQGGKDAKLRLLDLRRLNGRGSAGVFTGGEVQTVAAPGGEGVFTAPAVWRGGGKTWLFATTGSGTAAFTFERGRLRSRWRKSVGGTSPVVAGGLLYVYDADGGRLNVYMPGTGRRVASLGAAGGHWNSPIVTDGRVALPVGDANDHRTSGSLYIYRVTAQSRRLQRRAALRWKLISSRLESPTHVTSTKSQPNRLYVVEQPGTIRVFLRGRLLAKPFLDIRSIVKSGGEQGLLSVAFHPKFATNRRFYVDYTDRNGDTRVVEYRANRTGTAALRSTARQLLFVAQPYANHNGGQLAFGPDGRLYVGMGDGGSGGDPDDRAQNLDSRLGKLIRINVDRGTTTIAAYGLRNPWRFSFDRANGNLYLGDVGQNQWEEVDFLPRPGSGLVNFGWDAYEGNDRYESKAPNPEGALVAPVFVYSHAQGCSVTGGFVYRGRAIKAARGRYFFGDFCSGRIWTLRISRGRATNVRQEGQRLESLSSFGENARGELYAVTLDGRLYRLTG